MNFKKMLCGFTVSLVACVSPISTMAYTQQDINSARFAASMMTPLLGRGYSNPDLAARLQYYNDTLKHLKDVLNMGFTAYTKSLEFNWDIGNIPVIRNQILTAQNFVPVITDAINLYIYLRNNP